MNSTTKQTTTHLLHTGVQRTVGFYVGRLASVDATDPANASLGEQLGRALLCALSPTPADYDRVLRERLLRATQEEETHDLRGSDGSPHRPVRSELTACHEASDLSASVGPLALYLARAAATELGLDFDEPVDPLPLTVPHVRLVRTGSVVPVVTCEQRGLFALMPDGSLEREDGASWEPAEGHPLW